MSSSNAAVSPGPPQEAEGSEVKEVPEVSAANKRRSSTGAQAQSQHDKAETSAQGDVSAVSPIFDEIRLMQARLSYLEGQAAQQWKATVEDETLEDSHGGQDPKSSVSDGDEMLRKHIRKAPSGKRWVERVEQIAEAGADERKDYGRKDSIDGTKSTMYHVQPSGNLLRGDEFAALLHKQGWFNTHGIPTRGLLPSDEARFREHNKAYPHRGVRPPTSVHQFYEKPIRREREAEVHPPTLSRKLGPPTKWDESDSEEWSSDTSTRSQDFKYFRARLRGDFEWELDRLNAQVMRYRKHQNKKKSRELAIQAQKDKERKIRDFGPQERNDDFITNLGHDTVAAGKNKPRTQQLSPVGWSAFLLRLVPGLIDVLIEEPKLSSNLKPWGNSKREKQGKNAQKKELNLRTPAATDVSSKDDAAQGLRQSTPWTVRDPLPERIRINSKKIIGILSSIHGSPLYPDADETSSVALLRPFKILHAYDKEIREMCSKLEDDAAQDIKRQITGTANEGVDEERARPNTSPGEENSEKPSEAADETGAEKDKETPTSREEQHLQLEHLSCLREFMDEFIREKVAYLNSATCSKIFFSDVWHLFQPGTAVVSADGKQAYLVINLKSKRHKGADRWAAFWSRHNEKKRRKSDSSSGSSDGLADDKRADITVTCVFIHFDGAKFGPVLRTFQMNKWDGEKEVTYLDIYPIRFHVLKHLDKRPLTSNTKTPTSLREQEVEKGVKVLRQKLIDRGKVFLEVAAVKQMYYSGLAVDTRDEIESQVMVDFEEALGHETRKKWIPNIRRLVGNDWNSKTDSDEADEGCTAECCWQENVHDDAYVETNKTEKLIDDMMSEIEDTQHKLPSAIIYPRTLEQTKTGPNALTDDELMIMSYSVFGFVLRDRNWAKLDLDCMSAVRSPSDSTEQTDDDLEEGGKGAFGQLVLPAGHKKMVLSLISQHFRSKGSQERNDEQVDIVRGKGKEGIDHSSARSTGRGKDNNCSLFSNGLIEGVAETFGQPLFQITCGDLGSNPKDVEIALQTNFALANRWGCILLLDEADVFLAERRREDFNRNGLVAVFLRVLEYYAGILFLTTNRIGDFDEAFASRIHMSLHYPALDEVSTAKVFRLNLSMIKTRLQDRVKIEEDEIITAAGKHWRDHKHARWNGRQIRNACQTALALAEFEAQPKGKKYDIKEKSTAKIHLKLDHLKIVSNAYLEFTEYLKAVHGADAEGRAKESGLRALDTLLRDALKSDKVDRGSRDRRSSSPRRGQTGPETPFQDFRLRPSSSGQRPGPRMASPSSPEAASQHAAGHQRLHSPQRMAHEPPPRMQYSQSNQSAYMGNQPFMGDQRSGMHLTSQHVQPGSYLQAPQGYAGAGYGGHEHYQPSDSYGHDNQPMRGHGVYPSPPPSAARGGPAGGSAGLGHLGDDQSRQAPRGGQVPFDESEQM